MSLRIVAAYALMCAIWGTTWYAIKIALVGLPPTVGAGLRFLVAGLAFMAVALVVRPRGPHPTRRTIVVLALTLFGLNYALTYYAEARLPSGLVAVLFGTLPFFVFGLAAAKLREAVAPRVVGGAVLALAGVATISFTGVAGDVLAILATLGASFSSAYANVELKSEAESDPLLTLPPAMLLAGTGLVLGGLTYEHVDLQTAFTLAPVGATLYLALAGSALAFYLNHWLLQRLSTGVVGLSALIIPVLAVAFGTIVGHEPFGTRELVGALLVVLGMTVALAPLPKRQIPAYHA